MVTAIINHSHLQSCFDLAEHVLFWQVETSGFYVFIEFNPFRSYDISHTPVATKHYIQYNIMCVRVC